MEHHTIETVTFELEDGISKEQFLDVVAVSTEFVQSQPGFLARRLSRAEDGTWIEHIEWETLEAARAAAAAISEAESVKPFLKCISGPSAKLVHSQLEISVG